MAADSRTTTRAPTACEANARPRTAVALLLALSAEQVAHQRWSTDEIQRLSMW
jgi:hypothetical protein